MGDSVDLIVLGAYFGTGNKGGLRSVFLMGVYDEENQMFKTVCKVFSKDLEKNHREKKKHVSLIFVKVGNGFSDQEIADLQTSLEVVKIAKNPEKCPNWLDCKKQLLPDFVVKDPFK